ncbi:TPA: DNA ligase [Klebsiella pneumoniae]|uniref:ATP-dependent DNA ligase n=1 Tax=Enterobacteriaceae TaxID=543 RepID=UPI0006BCD15C|nr:MULTISPECIES: DNA ligase [Klebsiella/Raoultella group]RFP47230.1 DNA ligase [Klebsiella oxytoca]HCB2140906.1 DNA ligase [Escherichia coli]HDZ9770350.1 DNA ligase [Klebsiella variicola subsp. variicola]MBZ6974320.1 DNA ligase [Klebsiella grimontii]PJR08513.1 DNA ligase [Raoultella ornithinolytica]
MEKLIALKHKLDAIKTMGTNAKKEALANLDEFEQSMVSLMLNPFIRFGVKKYKVAEPLDTSVPSDQKVVELLEKLAARELTGNAAITAVESLVASMCADGQDVFRRFLLKDPKAGVGISLCNKVFENPIPKFEVQLASPYKEKGDKYPFKPNPKAKWPMIGSLKLDGLRVICEVIVDEEEVNFLTRTGNPITSLDHLKPAMLERGRLSGFKHIFFDGEGTAGTFNQSVSALRKKNVKAIGAVYHIFDFFLPEWRAQAKSKEYLKTGMKLKERLAMLVALFRNTCGEDYAQDVHLHPFYIIHNHEDFIERFMKRLDENEEGEMGKDPDSVYEFKRTRSWWKLKDEDSEDGEIIDFEPGDPDSGFAHTLGKIVIRLENGVIVRASGIKHKYLDEIWNNQEKYRGRIVEVHCHEKTPDGSLRHPRLKWPKCLRDTEDRIGDKD